MFPLSLTGTRITDNMIIFTREPTTRGQRRLWLLRWRLQYYVCQGENLRGLQKLEIIIEPRNPATFVAYIDN